MTEAMDAIFVKLVETSWKKYNEDLHNRHTDELLVGAVIAAMVEDKYALIDLNSDGVAHYLRFENLATRERLIFQLTNLAEDLVTAKVLRRHARVVIGYGEQVNNVGMIWQTLKSELKSSFLDTGEPGIITTDADLTAGYVYVQVPLLLELDPYFTDIYTIDYAQLREHIGATVHALRKYLRGRLQV
jgi:hypothetical protein